MGNVLIHCAHYHLLKDWYPCSQFVKINLSLNDICLSNSIFATLVHITIASVTKEVFGEPVTSEVFTAVKT